MPHRMYSLSSVSVETFTTPVQVSPAPTKVVATAAGLSGLSMRTDTSCTAG